MTLKYKIWRRRYFVIYDMNEIRYFENATLAAPKGKIELNKVTKIMASKLKQYHYKYCIELHTPERVWCLAADSKQERDVWMNIIQNIMKQHNGLYIFNLLFVVSNI